jgi:hypothetical protein
MMDQKEKLTEDAQQFPTAKSRYQKLENHRRPFLDRARQYAKLTIPMLLPEEGMTATASFVKPFQSIGARGAKNLASKIVNALYPPNTSNWRYMLDADAKAFLDNTDPQKRSKLESALERLERLVVERTETRMRRPKLNEAALQLIVSGNALLHVTDDGTLRVWRIDSYVVNRDPIGNLLEALTKEEVSPQTLDPLTQEVCKISNDNVKDDTVEIYTHLKLNGKKYSVYQEINGIEVPGSRGSYPKDACPWLALRFYAVDGEHYGRSYVEEHVGDLIIHESLSQAITEGTMAASRMLFLVRPGSATKASVLQKTPNGGVNVGDAGDISVMQVNKFNDFRVALDMLQDKTESLSKAFMLNSSIQRQAERVTATEVEYSARELEDTLGGIYSLLSQELQLPLIRVDLKQLEREGTTLDIPEDVAKPVPIGGLAALGRGNDADKLKIFAQIATEAQQQTFINWTEYLQRMGTALGVDTAGLVKTPEELQVEQTNAFMAQAGQQVAPQMLDQMLAGQMAQGQPEALPMA